MSTSLKSGEKSVDHDFNDYQLSCIQQLRSLIKSDPRLVIRTNNLFLTKFLYHCDWDVQKSLEFCYNFFKFRANNPDYFLSGPITELDHVIQANCKFMLENRDKNGRRIYITRASQYTCTNSVYDIAKMDSLWAETILDELETQKNGLSIILDVKNSPIQCLKWMQPKIAKLGTERAELTPIKNFCHIINVNGFVRKAITFSHKFMSPEAKKNLFIHDNYASLCEHIGAEHLPPMYGGTGKDIDINKLCNKLYEKEDIFLDYMIQGYIDPEPLNWDNQLI